MLGDRQRGLGGRVITAVISILAGWVFGTTAWQQFSLLPSVGRTFFTALFVLIGAGAIWLVYGLILLLRHLYRKIRRQP